MRQGGRTLGALVASFSVFQFGINHPTPRLFQKRVRKHENIKSFLYTLCVKSVKRSVRATAYPPSPIILYEYQKKRLPESVIRSWLILKGTFLLVLQRL
jgi:hypothetical protein